MRNADSPEAAIAWLEARFEQEWAAHQALPSPAVDWCSSWFSNWFTQRAASGPGVVAGFDPPAGPG